MNPAGHALTLPDGRRLAWTEHGDPAGVPLVYAHGVPGCGLEVAALGIDRAARRTGARLIAPDRPSMGGSDHRPGRRVLDWPDDLAVLADHLGLSRVAMLGYSGGVPFAAAAYRLPDRVAVAGLVACVAHLAPGLDDGSIGAGAGSRPWPASGRAWQGLS